LKKKNAVVKSVAKGKQTRKRQTAGQPKRKQAVGKPVAKGKKTRTRQPAGQPKRKKTVTVPVGSRIWDNLNGFFLFLNLVTRLWRRINGNDDSP